jgi:hypothetical protein
MLKLLLIVHLLLAASASSPIAPSPLAAALVGADRAAARSALLEIRHLARARPLEVRNALAETLLLQLRTNRDSIALRNVCSALGILGGVDAIPILLDRYAAETGAANKFSLLTGLSDLLHSSAAGDGEYQQRLTSVLEAVLGDPKSTKELAEAAARAASAMGPAGFDLLLRLRPDSDSPLADIWYTAVGETGDARAIVHLREAAAGRETPEGRRVQAITALKAIFASDGTRVSVDERDSCARMLYPFLKAEASDQLFSAALDALLQITSKDNPAVQAAIIAALQTEHRDRQMAALDALHEHPVLLSPDTLGLIKRLMRPDAPSPVRESAEAVVMTQALPGVSK